MTTPHFTCCAEQVPCVGCCGIFECDDCGMPNNLLLEHTWTDTVNTWSGQTLTVSEVTWTYQTGGVRTVHYSDGTDGCEEGTVVRISWSEVTVTVSATMRDYLSGSASACFENLNPALNGGIPWWQNSSEVCASGTCTELCEAIVGCEGWPNEVQIRNPSSFYTLHYTRTYDATIVIDSDGCPPVGNDEWDPINLVCVNDGCTDCARFAIQFNCRAIQNGQFVDPLAIGTFNRVDELGCEDPIVNEQWTILITPWAYTSDCACGPRQTWKRGYYWAIDPLYPPDYPAPASNWTFNDAHVDPFNETSGSPRGYVDRYGFVSYYNCFRPGDDLYGKSDHEWSWYCCRPEVPAVCVENCDAVYVEVNYSGTNTWTLDHGVTVTCQ